jgi:hypothetical protein
MSYGLGEKIGVKGQTGMEEDAKIAAEQDAKDAFKTWPMLKRAHEKMRSESALMLKFQCE